MSILFLPALAAIGWAGYSVVTGKGYYKGCPPGGFDRSEDPFRFWAPTLIIFALGIFLILIAMGLVPMHPRR